MNPVALYCVAVLGALLFGMGPVISAQRGKTGAFIGYEAEPTNSLYKWIRAHANTAEYAPFLAVLILYLGAHQPADWVIWTMIAVTAFRLIFVAGLVLPATMAKPNIMRFVGAAGTYFAGLALCAALLIG